MTTYVETIGGESLLFQFGDGADDEQFAASCSINTTRKVDLTSNVYTGEIAPCDEPSKPALTRRRIKSLDIKFSGAGLSDANSYKALMAKWGAGLQFNGILKQDLAGALGWTITGPWVIDSLSTGGARGEDQAFDIAISIADAFVIA
jgi:hypothetical protein